LSAIVFRPQIGLFLSRGGNIADHGSVHVSEDDFSQPIHPDQQWICEVRASDDVILFGRLDVRSTFPHVLISQFRRSPSQSIRLSPVTRGPRVANLMLRENNDVSPKIVVENKRILNESEKRFTGNRNKIGIFIPSAALAALSVLALPVASNAISIPIATASASYSAWFASLTDSGFYQAFSLVFLSEIGDKTFFVAALLAAKLSRFISFVGSLGALAVMTVISVVIGQVFHAVPSELANGIPLDDVAAVIAFTYFGIKILSEAFETDGEGKSAMDEEFEEAEETVEGSDTINKASAG
jgi:hypothetical protein